MPIMGITQANIDWLKARCQAKDFGVYPSRDFLEIIQAFEDDQKAKENILPILANLVFKSNDVSVSADLHNCMAFLVGVDNANEYLRNFLAASGKMMEEHHNAS
jgi:hypothetical protein